MYGRLWRLEPLRLHSTAFPFMIQAQSYIFMSYGLYLMEELYVSNDADFSVDYYAAVL